MEILYLLVPIALIFIALAIKLLFWAIKNGQYDDLDTEASRILFEQKKAGPSKSKLGRSDRETDASVSAKTDG